MLYVIGTYVLSVLLFPRTVGQMTARLVDGTSYAGRLEILYNGTWNTVCDDSFDNTDAQVACRMLGFYSPGGVAVTSNMYGAGQGSILLDEVNCRGTETSLEQCSHRGYYSHDCGHDEDIGVICNIPGQLTARLVNGTQWAGRLEILFNGTWSTVCDDYFENTDAQVACRMLGFNSPPAMAVSFAAYGAGQDSILLDDVNCTGTETSLSQCSHRGYYSHNCQHNEDVGIVCVRVALLTARLVNGSSSAGRLEILYNGTWSTVCDDVFENVDAQVACRMLGFNRPGAVAVSSATYGAGQGSILLDDVSCRGTETSLAQCLHRGYYSHDCQHSEDVGVVCNRPGQLTARLVNGTGWAGRLEILYNDTWSTVCDDFFENVDAQVACRMLGFNSPGAVAVTSDMYGAGKGSILLDDVDCNGTETSLDQCSHLGFFRHNCAHTEDVGVICNIPGQLTARLVNGTHWAGRLEILYNGTWSTVCDDQFGKEEAQVACKMMGFSRAEVLQVGSVVYGAGQGTILLDDLDCQGTETSLDQCSHLAFYQHNCQHFEDIGVICSNQSYQLRLAGTSRTSLYMGRPEILIGREWSMLCAFTNETAKVICRSLGFPSTNATVVASSFGPLQGRFLSDRVACVGNETSLFSCISSVTAYLDNCFTQHGVICSDSLEPLYIVSGANSSVTSYPFMEGTNVSLKCESLQQDQFITKYTWLETAGGRPSEEYLIFDNVNKTHRGGRVSCGIIYISSGTTQTAVSETVLMNVYYIPVISITSDQNECESLASFPNHCAVTQGHNVTFRCEADSNPPPALVRWSGGIYSNTREFQLISANRQIDQSRYLCIATTQSVAEDKRLPLTSSRWLTVIIKYPSTVLRFQMNAVDNKAIIVNENSSVDMLCQADGRPTPRMSLISIKDSNRVLSTRPSGEIQVMEETGELRHVINQIQCQDSGDYKCEVDNGVGQDSKTVRLLVLCAPKISKTEEHIPVLYIGDSEGVLSVQLKSYPPPDVASVASYQKLVNDGGTGLPIHDRIKAVCVVSSLAPAVTTCNITVDNVTKADEGFYNITFSNSLGQEHFPFTIIQSAFQLRLVGTSRTSLHMGRPEILIGRDWTMLCDVTEETARVICRLLGYASNEPVVVASSFGPLQGRFLNSKVRCLGNESNLVACIKSVSGYMDSCGAKQDMGIICNDYFTARQYLYIVVETNSTTTSYPFMEGTNVSLKCESAQRNPLITQYTWPETAGGRPSREYLIFDNVTGDHNGERVKCGADYYSSETIQTSFSETLLMQVYCSPRRRDTKEQVPLLNVRESEGLLTLEMTAYPTPYVASTTYNGAVTTYNDSSEGVSVEDTVKTVCVASKISPAFVTCNITVVNLTHVAVGFYRIIFRNSLGSFSFVFRTIRNSEGDESSPQVTAIIAGVCSAVIVALAISSSALLCRRLVKPKENDNIYDRPVIREQSDETTYSALPVNRVNTSETFPMGELENTGTDRVNANTTELGNSASPIYENVDTEKPQIYDNMNFCQKMK